MNQQQTFWLVKAGGTNYIKEALLKQVIMVWHMFFKSECLLLKRFIQLSFFPWSFIMLINGKWGTYSVLQYYQSKCNHITQTGPGLIESKGTTLIWFVLFSSCTYLLFSCLSHIPLLLAYLFCLCVLWERKTGPQSKTEAGTIHSSKSEVYYRSHWQYLKGQWGPGKWIQSRRR